MKINIKESNLINVIPSKTCSNPLVSVCVSTYNHEKYIKECLDSLLLQQTNFEYEILLGEDDSSDATREICLAYAKQYPEKIRLFLHNRNNVIYINGHPTGRYNFVYNLIHANGKYIAICEGDDYWTDPLKLQKQVDFLEQHSDYAICFHPVKVYNESQQKFIEDTITRNVTPTTTLQDLAIRNYIHTPSIVFRNTQDPLPEWFLNTPLGDYPLICTTALSGKIFRINEEMAVYRVQDKGLITGYKKQDITKKITFNNGMMPLYEYIYKKSGIPLYRKTWIHLLIANQSYAIQMKDYTLSRKYSYLLLTQHFFSLSAKQITSTLLSIFIPSLLKRRYAQH